MTCSGCGKIIKGERYETFSGLYYCWKCALKRATELLNDLKAKESQ